MAKSLPINVFVDVKLEISPISAPRKTFDVGLIVGPSAVIPEAERVRIYASVDAMLDDGFLPASVEYQAAVLYFSQSPKPTRLAVGVQAGSETPAVALRACREANAAWYVAMVCGATDEEILEAAAYIEAATPSSALFFATKTAATHDAVDTDIFSQLMDRQYRRTLGQFSATEDAVAAIMGYAMGANTGLADSAYTLQFKPESGVPTDGLSLTQAERIWKKNANTYSLYGETYRIFSPGIMASGIPFDELINLDMLQSDIELNVMDLLYQSKKVPQTEEGVSRIVAAVASACQQAVDIGFLAPGIWNGPKVRGLYPGDALPKGYLVVADSVASQPQADRGRRISPPVYACVKTAGAIGYVVIGVNVNR